MLSIVVPVYLTDTQGFALFARCLDSLCQQWNGDFEVIVVDDGSPMAYQPDRLKNKAPRRSTFIRLPENQGRAVARNRGWKRARAPWVLFLDADMALQAEAVGAHLDFHRAHGFGWIAQGHIVGQQYLDQEPVESVWTDASQAFFATGQVSIAREALIQTGGFDEDFTAYGWEDLELGLRLKQLGYRQKKLKTAISFHFEPPFSVHDAEDWTKAVDKEQQRAHGALLFLQKHPQAKYLCQASAFDAQCAHLLLSTLPTRPFLQGLVALQKRHPKLALALYRGLLHQHYVQALNALK